MSTDTKELFNSMVDSTDISLDDDYRKITEATAKAERDKAAAEEAERKAKATQLDKQYFAADMEDNLQSALYKDMGILRNQNEDLKQHLPSALLKHKKKPIMYLLDADGYLMRRTPPTVSLDINQAFATKGGRGMRALPCNEPKKHYTKIELFDDSWVNIANVRKYVELFNKKTANYRIASQLSDHTKLIMSRLGMQYQ